MKLKSLVASCLILCGFSSNTFGATQAIGCGGEQFGDVITTFFTQSQVTYNQTVTAGQASSITIGQIYSTCDQGQYGSSPDQGCSVYNGGPYGGVSVDEPVQLTGQLSGPQVGEFIPTSANNRILTGGWTYGNQQGECSYEFTYTVVSFECSDNQPNDGDGLNDSADPQCHTDCNPNNTGSYTPNHNSESTPPNGSCPDTPTLQLNGRAAFLQIVKNFIAFITTKTFALTQEY